MKKIIIGLVLGIILSGTIAYAGTMLARDVDYDNTNSQLKDANNQNVDNVQDAIDALYTKANNQQSYNKIVFITSSHKKSTSSNNVGFLNVLYSDNDYITFSSNTVTIKKDCKLKIHGFLTNTAATTSNPQYKIIHNNSNLLSIIADKTSGASNSSSAIIDAKTNDTLYAQMIGGDSNYTYYEAYFELINE